MSRTYAIALAVLFAFANPARAEKVDVQVTMSKSNFDALRSHMIAQLDSASSAGITPTDKAAVIGALDRIDHRLAKSPMGDQDRVDIFNDQALINQITAHAKVDSRIYCERDQRTGSHVTRVTCMSLAQWREQEQAGQAAMRSVVDNHRTTCSGCIIDGLNPAGL